MKLETFFEKFDQFAGAPDAVAKMRELVLHLALHGGFSGEDSKSWKSALLEEILDVQNGFAFKSSLFNEVNHGMPLIRIRDIASSNTQVFYGGDYREEFIVRRGDLIIGMDGNFNIHRWQGDDALLNQRVCRLRNLSPRIDQQFLFYFIQEHLDEIHRNTTYTTVKHLSSKQIKAIRLPLPPLAEQKRIVAKVDELTALCDRLEAQQQERDTRRAALARASLARFADVPTPANLQYLFHKSYDIYPADLRKSILTLAVQGKLVPQDPNDEPAKELIARITAMRQAKKAKQYEPVTVGEATFEVPRSWSWVRLGNISLTSNSGWSPQCLPEARSGSGWGVLKVSAVSWGVFKPEENKALPPGMESRPDCEVKSGDFLLSRANTEELVARSVVVDRTPPRLMMSDKIVRFTFPDEIERAYINLANTSVPSRDYYARNASGTSSSMKNVGREVMCNLPIPLPPLAEQRRIVAKVDHLIALVDELETQLAASRVTAKNLLEALVAELTAAGASSHEVPA